MKEKLNTTLFLTLLALTISISCSKKEKETALASEVKPVEVANDLPQMTVTMTDGTLVETKKLEGGTIIILFQPDCDHCQREAQQIKAHLEAFKNYSLYFVSTASITEIQTFSKQYELENIGNIHFGAADMQSILNNFGSIPAPSVYIYNSLGKLNAKFNGETDINKILSNI